MPTLLPLSSQRNSHLSLIPANLLIIFLAFCVCGCKLGKSSGIEVNKNPCIVLALPTSGPYEAQGAKIRRGAEAAKKQFATAGINVRLENINTEAPDWLKRLDALPSMCAVVGGPLQQNAYLAARKAGEFNKRVFFPFMANLQKGDEGAVAWRFFPSPQDQIDALIGFTNGALGIKTYGAFYPADNYGARMTEILEGTLGKRHLPLRKASYNPAAPATWGASLRPLLKPGVPAGGSNAVPQTEFEAIFLPDSWKNMDSVTSTMLAQGEDRLILMGPTLWEQALSGKTVPKAGKYALAIFPVAWNSAKASPALRGAGNDFWSALGYDFVAFAVNTGLSERLPAEEVTARAQAAAPNARALAPISWDNGGIAHQQLYLFQVGDKGLKPANVEQLKQARAAARDRFALRAQGLANAPVEQSGGEQSFRVVSPTPVQAATLKPEPEPEPVASPEPAEAPATKAAPAPSPSAGSPGIIGTVPHPSYKLSLPAKRQ